MPTKSIELLAEAGLDSIPSEWDVLTIEQLLSKERGIAVGVMYPGNHDPLGIPLIRAGDLNGNRINPNPDFRITTEKHTEYKRTALEGGELLLSLVGNLGQCAIVPNSMVGWNAARAIAVIRLADKSNAEFVRLCLMSKPLQYLMNAWATTTVQATLNLKEIKELPIPWPSKSERDAWTSTINAIDDKIELNRRMNRTLESMARAVFRQWFVESEEVADWEVGKLGDVAKNTRRSANANEIDPETHYIGLEHMPRGSITLSEWGNASELASNKFIFEEGEFLFGKLRPYFHKVGIAPVNGVCSTDILVIAPQMPEWYGFVLGHISSVELINYTNAASTGTKMPRTNWSDIANYEVVIPPVEKAKEFNEILLPMAQLIRANIMESRTLASLRDTLLPRLMRGEARVK